MFVAGCTASRQGGPRVRSAQLRDRDAVALSFAVEDKGILPDRMIAALNADGGILSESQFAPDQIQPASLDLRLGEVAYRVRASFLPGRTTVAQRIDELKLHEIRSDRRRGAGNGLRLYRAAAGKPGVARRDFSRRQSEKLDRPARRIYPRDRRRDARLRPYRARLPRPALCRDQPAHVSGAGARGFAFVANSLSPRSCAARCRCVAQIARKRAAGRCRRCRRERRRCGRRRSFRSWVPAVWSVTAPSAIPD